MNNIFSYSILQYKHSVAVGEALNVGILFAFPESQTLRFVYGTSNRLKAIYPNFDSNTFNHLLKSIESKLVASSTNLFFNENFKGGIVDFIHTNILREDSTSLQFQEPQTALNTFGNNEKTIEEFSKLLLPSAILKKQIVKRTTEDVILKKFTSSIYDRNPSLESRFERDRIIKANHLSVKFDLAWQNGSLNLIKAISFDLIDRNAIQAKAISNFGTLTALSSHAKNENIKFDLLISEPQNTDLLDSYNEALQLIGSADTNKKLILPDKIDEYSDYAYKYLSN